MSLNPLDQLHWHQAPPDTEEFIAMRAACGWGQISTKTAHVALVNGLFNVSVYHADTLVGFGRAVGDGALYFYLQDIVVDPNWRSQGIGHQIVVRLLGQIRAVAAPGSTIGLMAAKGAEDLYARHGFSSRPNGSQGAGMTMVI